MLYEVAKDDVSKKELDSVFLDSFSLEKKSKVSFRDFFDVPSNYKDDCSSFNRDSQPQVDSQVNDCNNSNLKNNISEPWEALNYLTHHSHASNEEIQILTHTTAKGCEQQPQMKDSQQTLFGVSDDSSQSPVQKKVRSPIEFMEGAAAEPFEWKEEHDQNSFDIIEHEMRSHQTQKDQNRPSETDTKDATSVQSTPSRQELNVSPTPPQQLKFDMRRRLPADNSTMNLYRPADAEVPQENAYISIPASQIPMSMMSRNSRDNSIESASKAPQ